MNIQNSKNSRLLVGVALCWILVHLAAFYHFYAVGISLRTNIFDLLSTEDNNTSQSHRAAILLNQQAQTLRFVVVGTNEEQAFNAATVVENGLQKIDKIVLTKLPSQNLVTKHAIDYLAQGRAGLLTPNQQSLFSQNSPPEKLIETVSQKLYSPLSPFYGEFLVADPLLLLPEAVLNIKFNNEAKIKNGFLLKQHNDNRVAFTVLAKLPTDGLNIHAQTELVNQLNLVATSAMSQFPNTKIRWSGMIAFAQSSAMRMESDIKLVSTLGAIFTVCLLFAAFRSLNAVLFSIASIFSGVLIGTYFVVLVQGNIHLLTIGFGSSLIGACIDYSLHFFAEFFYSTDAGQKSDARATRKKVIVPIALGTITSILAFAALLFSDFAGLQELSLFSIGSLFATCTTVLLCIPLLLNTGTTHKPPKFIVSLIDKISEITHLGRRNRAFLLIAFLILLLPGVFKVQINDDIRTIQAPSTQLIETEQWIAEASGLHRPSSYLFVVAPTKSEVLEYAYTANASLSTAVSDQLLDSFENIYGLIAPPKAQEQNAILYHRYLRKHAEAITKGLLDLGYEQSLIDGIFNHENVTREVSELLNVLPLETGANIYQDRQNYWVAIALHGVRDHLQLRQRISSYKQLQYYQAADEISKQFRAYRTQSTLLVIVAYTLIFLLLLRRYGLKKGFLACIPLLGSIFIVIATLGYLQQPVSFFSIIAMIIVIGLGVDFYIFLLEDTQQSIVVKTSVILSAFSTIITFALLAMSDTAVLKTIGFVISIGVSSAMLLALIVISTIPKK